LFDKGQFKLVAGQAFVQIVLSAINAVSGFMEGDVVYLVNTAGFRCKRCVGGQLFREVVAVKEIMITYS